MIDHQYFDVVVNIQGKIQRWYMFVVDSSS